MPRVAASLALSSQALPQLHLEIPSIAYGITGISKNIGSSEDPRVSAFSRRIPPSSTCIGGLSAGAKGAGGRKGGERARRRTKVHAARNNGIAVVPLAAMMSDVGSLPVESFGCPRDAGGLRGETHLLGRGREDDGGVRGAFQIACLRNEQRRNQHMVCSATSSSASFSSSPSSEEGGQNMTSVVAVHSSEAAELTLNGTGFSSEESMTAGITVLVSTEVEGGFSNPTIEAIVNAVEQGTGNAPDLGKVGPGPELNELLQPGMEMLAAIQTGLEPTPPIVVLPLSSSAMPEADVSDQPLPLYLDLPPGADLPADMAPMRMDLAVGSPLNIDSAQILLKEETVPSLPVGVALNISRGGAFLTEEEEEQGMAREGEAGEGGRTEQGGNGEEEISLELGMLVPKGAVRRKAKEKNGQWEEEVRRKEEEKKVREAAVVRKRKGMREQVELIGGFAGPALGIWLSHPLMSLIDTAVVGNMSSTQLAALGPGTVLCDQISFLFMFLSVATSNLIATSVAQQNEEEASSHLGRLLFVAAGSGLAMVLFSHYFSLPLIKAFVGENRNLIPAACLYAKIRGFAWPAVLITSVAQSASLGVQDSFGPLRVLLVASMVNLTGDILLCPVLGLGIAGAAWATTVSQYIGCILMLHTIHKAKRLRLSVICPSPRQLLSFMSLAGPIFVVLLAKTGFYTLLTFVATSLGTVPLAAHQVLIGIFALCAVCAEPLSQTAQSFLPGLTSGPNRDMSEARSLLRTLAILGAIFGFLEASAAAVVPWFLPNLFTTDASVISQMRQLVPPLCISLLLNPLVLSSEGTLLAGRDVSFLATSMMGCFAVGSLFLLALQRFQLGLMGNWWALVAFQVVRLLQAMFRILSPHSIFATKPRIEEIQAQKLY